MYINKTIFGEQYGNFRYYLMFGFFYGIPMRLIIVLSLVVDANRIDSYNKNFFSI